jgi:hypothetical protein
MDRRPTRCGRLDTHARACGLRTLGTSSGRAVELEAEDAHEGRDGEEHAAAEHAEEGEHEEHAEHEGEESHTEFHAEYAITCDSPGDLGTIDFAFFERFPDAQEIELTLITESGQTRYEVERDAPRIDLKGLI